MYKLNYLDTCLPDFFGGHHLPVVQVVVDSNSTNFSVTQSLLDSSAIAHLDELKLDFNAYKQAVVDCFASCISIHSFSPAETIEDSDDDDSMVYAFFALEITMNETYQKVYLNKDKTRWCRLDQYGNRDKMTLFTKSGKSITRTIQFYEIRHNRTYIQITYKGERGLITPTTTLED